MPKDKKRAKHSSDSDSGPDDRSPAKKGKTSDGANSSGMVNALPGTDPSWSLGNMKFVKASKIFIYATYVTSYFQKILMHR